MSENELPEADESDIAVVGSSAHFPGARNVREFWQNLRDGVESIRRFSDDELRGEGVPLDLLRDPHYVKSGAVLDDMEYFDAEFFNLTPRDASIMDPQHRHLLECAWEALESAAHPPETFDGAIGVFAGCGMNAYMMFNILTNQHLVDSVGMFLLRHTGNDKDFLSTRISYDLNLKGPSINVQTACSTSLVAIHMACQSLLSGECDMALAGGVTIEIPHRRGYVYREGEILSPDGHCHAFDSRAQGTIFGSGAGLVVLRRLADALADGDTIHAVVKGSAINNDGSGKVGYLAPSVDGQAAAIAEALSVAGVPADSIDYVETHGTGTAMGDPIEVSALTQAFRQTTERTQYCGIGSVKTNIGHLDTAAGVANFIKVVESIKHAQIPPSLNYESPNPIIDFEGSPFYVNATLRDWPRTETPRRAGVSSLGVGGTNAHVVLEEAPSVPPSDEPTRSSQVIVLSARNRDALDEGARRLATHLREERNVHLADLAYTLQVGRRAFPERLVLACRNAEEAIDLLERPDRGRVFTCSDTTRRSVVFMFPGGGAQYARMGVELYASEPIFRKWVDRGLDLLAPLVDYDPRAVLFSPPEDDEATERMLDRPAVQLPLIMILEHALAQTWMSYGVHPAALIGHSMGENSAACVAGVMSFEDCLGLVVLRGQLFEEMPEGGMLSVAMSAEDVRDRLDEELDLATVNAPELCVVSGPVKSLEAFARRLAEDDIDCRRVPIAIAAHSKMLDGILGRFGDYLKSIELQAPTIPFVSNLTGTWIREDQAIDPQYWVQHLRNTILFSEGIGCLAEEPDRIYLEIGPGKTLSSLAKQHHGVTNPQAVFGSMRHAEESIDDDIFFSTSIGRLWAAGFPIDWTRLHGDDRRLRVPLPSYAFQRQRHWIEPGVRALEVEASGERAIRLPFEEWFSEVRWTPGRLPQPGAVDAVTRRPGCWLIFAEALSGQLATRLEAAGQKIVSVHAGGAFEKRSPSAYVIDPADPEDYSSLLGDLREQGFTPDRILHAWSLTGSSNSPTERECQERGFFSVFHLAKALALSGLSDPVELTLLADGMIPLIDGEESLPAKATLLGPARVIPREMPEIRCRVLDLPLMRGDRDDEALLDALEGLLARADGPTLAAIRDGRLWTSERVPLRLSAPEEGEPRLSPREGGTYLVTGGLSGVGLAIASHLAEAHRARLVLVGRRGMPPRSEWNALLSGEGADDEVRRIRSIMRIEEFGGRVLVLAADVTDREAMERVLNEAEEAFGNLHGVLHCAGVLEDAPIALKDVESLQRVLAAKVYGTLALDRALANRSLDFFVVFSSTSAQLGLAGQVDYTAANAFLNAFARERTARGAGYTVAIGWGTWADVGMAANAARNLGLVEHAAPEFGVPERHPLLGERYSVGENEHHFVSDLAVQDLWILDEHRIREFGALLPGTGYIELMRAAFAASGQEGAVRIEELVFIAPLRVDPESPARIRTVLRRENSGFRCTVMSRSGATDDGETLWRDHAHAVLSADTGPASPRRSISEIQTRCSHREIHSRPLSPQTKQEAHLQFGPRWKNLEWTRFGEDEALASIALPTIYADDLGVFEVHPALLDIATGCGLPLLKGYEECDDLYVPMVYESIRIFSGLPTRFFSHLRRRSSGGAGHVVTFDVTLMDGQGGVLVEIEGFSMRRIAPSVQLDEAEAPEHLVGFGTVEEPSVVEGPLALLQRGVREGIHRQEGAEALRRILAHRVGPEVVVSSLDLGWLREQADPARNSRPQPDERDSTTPSASAQTYLDGVEEKVARIWQDLLGITAIGRDDEFFDVGGHSLLGIRVINKINGEFGTSLEPAMLFESPTVALLSELIRSEKPDLAGAPTTGRALEGAKAAVESEERVMSEREKTDVKAGGVTRANLAAIAAIAPNEPPRHRPTNSGRPYAMREHWLCRHLLAPLFAIRRRRVRKILEWMILKLEGGEWFTVTLRKLYARHFDMEIGDYTGSCFDPGQFKRGTRIGRYCSIFPTARIETANHPSNTISTNGIFYQPGAGFSEGYSIPRNRVEIGNDVHIGHNASILFPAQKIGDGAIIGTGTIVDFDVPPYAIVAGSPAAIIRYRFPKQRIQELLESKWWNATLEEIQDVRAEFVLPLEGKSVR